MMAGTISLSPEQRWTASGWLFDWAVEFLAANVTEPGLKAGLEEIVTENLGWLGLGDFGPSAEREMRTLLRTNLLAAADGSLPPDMDGRRSALDLLSELAAAAEPV
ncbi:hypothetical protein KOI35_44135 [Actinoplanes bogorensis]|uniref:Uncharacterized protein n=1 Tax=Paractinoplanes bogorensis TaxID=1610840 RepID=A0ABS5Z4B2_9ACTN|nr:hypothetical protein [Actinoplanes bogorensis]MBU2670513.1 hypothetical protein [Actinoplanes bogorensis]